MLSIRCIKYDGCCREQNTRCMKQGCMDYDVLLEKDK